MDVITSYMPLPSDTPPGMIMAKLQSLETFSLHEHENGYRLLVSAVGGDAIYVEITPAQMDDIIDSLDAALGSEEEVEDPDA
jgi:hypothetical protein